METTELLGALEVVLTVAVVVMGVLIAFILGVLILEELLTWLQNTDTRGDLEIEMQICDKIKENAELDCQKNRNKFCYSCANATERCFRNEIGCPCEKYKSYKDENARLKSIADFQTSSNMDRYFKLKRSKERLTKAKDLLLRFIELKNKPCAVGYSVNMLLYENICADVKQFLKDSEVEK